MKLYSKTDLIATKIILEEISIPIYFEGPKKKKKSHDHWDDLEDDWSDMEEEDEDFYNDGDWD